MSALQRSSSLSSAARPALSTSSAAGFTLVELMVALFLAALISVSIMYISTQARDAYTNTIKKVDVYNRFRFAFHSLEEDLRRWNPTSDLEFFVDGRGKGGNRNSHWDPQEEVPDTEDAEYGYGVVDGGSYGEYDEYAHIVQRHYASRERFQFEDKLHDAYQVYFRTTTFVDGAARDALVEYKLLDPNYGANNGGAAAPESAPRGRVTKVYPPPRQVLPDNVADLALYKIVRYFDISYSVMNKTNETPILRKVIEVCPNVTDFKVEYLVLGNSRTPAGFRTPEEEYNAPAEDVIRPTVERDLGAVGGFIKRFGYGSVKLNAKTELATAFPARRGDDNLSGTPEHRPVQFGFNGNPRIQFSELIPGDKIFIFTESTRGGGGAAAAAGVAGNLGSLARFPAGDYTIRANFSGLLEFEEDLDTVTWGTQPQTGIYYKAAFMPAALRLTLRVVDDRGENPKTIVREIWLRRRSR